jgi:hypothetical protein
MDSLVNRVAHALKGRDTKKPNDRDSGGQVVDWVRRAPRMQLAELKANDLVGLLDSPKVKQAIDDNPTVRQMQADSRKAVRGSLEKVYDRARAVKNAKSVEDLSKLTKGRVPALEQLKKLPEEERKGVEQGIVKAAKEAGIKVYVAGLTKRIQQAVKAGVPEDHPYVVDHTKALQKIKAL